MAEKKVILAYPEKCSNCKLCVVTCSIINTNEVNPLSSRIEIIEYDWNHNFPVYCYQCEDCPPMAACPVEAISRDLETNITKIDYNKCIHCRTCVRVCPFGAIGVSDKGYIHKCELCTDNGQDGPQCVAICPYEALKFVLADEEAHLEKEKFVGNYALISADQ